MVTAFNRIIKERNKTVSQKENTPTQEINLPSLKNIIEQFLRNIKQVNNVQVITSRSGVYA